MQNFNIDPRNGIRTGVSCGSCCCDPAIARPGETDKWRLFYAAWSVPIGGRGLTTGAHIAVEKINPDIVSTTNAPPVAAYLGLKTDLSTAVTGDLSTVCSDPENDTLTYKLLDVYGPDNGTLTFAANGAFTYTPNGGWSGVDRFFYTVTDTNDNVTVGEVGIRVNAAAPSIQYDEPPATDILSVVIKSHDVSSQQHLTTLTVKCSPAAKVGDVYRVTVRQPCLDCDCEVYWHVSCYDVAIVKC